MTLPSSGQLKLSNIQSEFGGSNPIKMSEYYAGGGRVPSGTSGTGGPIPSSGLISISDFYGSQAALDVQTVTVGVQGSIPERLRGFLISTFGSIADGSSNLYGGAAIRELYHNEDLEILIFVVSGIRANSGWSTLTAGSPFNRASATYSNPSGNSRWTWAGVTTSPFIVPSSEVVCSFT